VVDAFLAATDWFLAGPGLAVGAASVGTLFIAVIQMEAERRRRRVDEHVWQARRVSGWPGAEVDRDASEPSRGRDQEIVLENGSGEPVWRAVVTLVMIQGAAWRTGEELQANYPPNLVPSFQRTMGLIPPGRSRIWVDGNWHAMQLRAGVEVAFTDRAGVHWVRRANGNLEELNEAAFDHYKVVRPMSHVVPEPVRL
jgi:hypothetical protein